MLEHTGGATVDAGTPLTVSVGGGQNVTLSEPIGEGDTLYLHVTDDGSVEAQLNSRPSVPASAQAFRNVQVTGALDGIEFSVAPPADS